MKRGNVLLELALCATLLGGLFAAAFEYGQSIWIYNALLDAVREGARHAMRSQTCGPEADSAIRSIVVRAGQSLDLRPVHIDIRRRDGFAVISIRDYSVPVIFGSRAFNGSPSLTVPDPRGCPQ